MTIKKFYRHNCDEDEKSCDVNFSKKMAWTFLSRVTNGYIWGQKGQILGQLFLVVDGMTWDELPSWFWSFAIVSITANGYIWGQKGQKRAKKGTTMLRVSFSEHVHICVTYLLVEESPSMGDDASCANQDTDTNYAFSM